jgi:hypothetical protein
MIAWNKILSFQCRKEIPDTIVMNTITWIVPDNSYTKECTEKQELLNGAAQVSLEAPVQLTKILISEEKYNLQILCKRGQIKRARLVSEAGRHCRHFARATWIVCWHFDVNPMKIKLRRNRFKKMFFFKLYQNIFFVCVWVFFFFACLFFVSLFLVFVCFFCCCFFIGFYFFYF